MSDHRIIPGVWTDFAGDNAGSGPRPTWRARLAARLYADRFDALLAVGTPAPAGSALAVHAARLESWAEREELARALRQSVADARDTLDPAALMSTRVPVHTENVNAATGVIDAITLRLHSPRPVSARGMARLRRVMGDGRGPFYRNGSGDLRGRLGAALAAL